MPWRATTDPVELERRKELLRRRKARYQSRIKDDPEYRAKNTARAKRHYRTVVKPDPDRYQRLLDRLTEWGATPAGSESRRATMLRHKLKAKTETIWAQIQRRRGRPPTVDNEEEHREYHQLKEDLKWLKEAKSQLRAAKRHLKALEHPEAPRSPGAESGRVGTMPIS